MRPSSILCLLVVLGLPAFASAQAKPSKTRSEPAAAPPAASAPTSQRTADAGTAAPDPGPQAAPETPPAREASPEQASPEQASPEQASPEQAAPEPASPEQTPPGEAARPEAAEPSPQPAGPEPSAGTQPSPTQPEPAADSGNEAKRAPSNTPAPGPHEAAGAAAPEANIPSPGELGDRLAGGLPPLPELKDQWTAPVPLLTLHGYFRVRGELMDTFWLGRGINNQEFVNQENRTYNGMVTLAGLGPDPFSRFRPFERSMTGVPCATEGTTTDAVGQVCKADTIQDANARFRFAPQLNLTEDVRIKSMFDIFDNYVLGQAPRNPGSDQLIVPKRVWAEVRNRDLGELRFGIMPDQWGLGMLYNAGNGLDDDYGSTVGRVMGTTKLAGFYLSAAYDFPDEGPLSKNPGVDHPNFDASQLDDVDQFTFSVVRRVPDEDEDAVLERGDPLLNGGARFQLRHQTSVWTPDGSNLQSLNSTVYTPDLWGQLRYRKLRLEIEAAWMLGKQRNLHNDQHQYISKLGAALESELRLLNDKLGIYLYAGAATGDSSVEGLSADADLVDASERLGPTRDNNHRVSTFAFNPSYHVDLILWRSLMGRVAGAYYARPGISYDFVHDAFGQLFGARLDVIYSRASSFMQTWGNDPNLGVELDAQVYWRSDDGPGADDGYHALLEYGVLFPMRGLGYYYKDAKLDTAQTLRLILGVVF